MLEFFYFISYLSACGLSDDQTCNDLDMLAPIYIVRRERIFIVNMIFSSKYVELIRDEVINIKLQKTVN